MHNRIPVCDKQTDGRTSCQGIIRVMHRRTHGAVKKLQISLFVSTQSTNVTGGQTHGQTDRHRMTAKQGRRYPSWGVKTCHVMRGKTV